MNGIYITIEEFKGTDDVFSTEVYLSRTEEDAKKVEESLIADMCETMSIYDADKICDAQMNKEISGEEWWYRVRTEAQGFYPF